MIINHFNKFFSLHIINFLAIKQQEKKKHFWPASIVYKKILIQIDLDAIQKNL